MSDDPDRDAILNRRRRFIAIALSGLTSAACSGELPPSPQPCLEAPIEEPVGGTGPEVPSEPQPCLSVVELPEEDEEPVDQEEPPAIDEVTEPQAPRRPRTRRGSPRPCLSAPFVDPFE